VAGASFNDAESRITNNPFLYLNRNGLSLHSLSPTQIILAEQVTEKGGGQWVCESSGGLDFLPTARYGQDDFDAMSIEMIGATHDDGEGDEGTTAQTKEE
jgi:hypothetical protein